MLHYYLYLLDTEGHIKAREILNAPDDGAAMEKALAYLREHRAIPAVEVWLAERRVGTLKQPTLPAT
jgi:hypothetical protein